ncbi:hypothetical protein Zmor_017844 [Zophobas morio]|uniref:Uncharacterized protein n=1 Tax=Zophobas morio TaxID=2755281 RepID=A0AA38IC91_9CUCU|nr:hypothetical protein Zmor_017844 [Zophobas morio]
MVVWNPMLKKQTHDKDCANISNTFRKDELNLSPIGSTTYSQINLGYTEAVSALPMLFAANVHVLIRDLCVT